MTGQILSLEDVREQAWVTDSADVVIVGTGAAGATAARVLTEAGLDVILVEEGPSPPPGGFRQDAYTGFKGLWRDLGFQVAQGRALLPILQGKAVGGTTVVNGAIIHRIPEKILDGWRTDGAVDDLLSMEALEARFETLDAELSVGPAPEDALGNNSALMREGVVAIGAKGNVIRRNVKDCQASGRCNQGCPTGRKQSMHLTYVPQSVARGARVYATCEVTRVVTEGGRAVAVEGRFRPPVGKGSGPAARFTARRAVLLAASAIQTPALLAKSGLRHPLLGRRLQLHPGTGVMARFDRPVEMWHGATQGFETTHFWEDGMKMETVGVPLEIGGARLPGFGADLVRRLRDFGHVAQWGVQVRAKAHGRVRPGLFGGTRITYDLADEDVRRFKVGIERLVTMMFAAGAAEVWPGVVGLPESVTSPDGVRAIHDLPDDPRRFHFIAAHLFGTAAMHADRSRGVVRPDGRCHDVDALYVVDSSVFPTNLGVNPQHTICAVSWRIAERIAGA